MRIAVRAMVPKDVEVVVEIIRLNFAAHARLAQRDFQRFFALPSAVDHQFLVAERDGRVVGCVGFQPDEDEDAQGVFLATWLYVHTEHQRQGVGGLLYAGLERCLTTLGARKVYVDVGNESDQYSATAFYLKQGFTKEGELKNYFREGQDKQIFGRCLTQDATPKPETDSQAVKNNLALTTEIEDMPWSQNTIADIEFCYKVMKLKGRERILDLACGTGRHALEFARRGHPVVAVDISSELVERGRARGREENLSVEFIRANILDLSFAAQFDVVVNLWEGGIGYLETEEENLEVFKIIGRALKNGGHHLAGPLLNADYARRYFPTRTWEKSDKMMLISELLWNEDGSGVTDCCWRMKRLSRTEWYMSEQPHCADYRIYTPDEISSIMKSIGFRTQMQYKHPAQTPGVRARDVEFWIHSIKEN